MRYHIIAFLTGFLLDLVFGDPHWLPHPIRLIGKLITKTEKALRKSETDNVKVQIRRGAALVFIVLASVTAAAFLLLLAAYRIYPYLGMAVECLMTYQILAAKCLKDESMTVYRCLQNGDLDKSRRAVSMIVGRDTDCLDKEGVAKAAVETVAENTSDGVIAPMLYLAVGGPTLGFFYKAVNTMDSMIGYRNDKYLYFGRAAAKLDDIVNFIPARISAYLMIAAAFLTGGEFSGKHAAAVYKRDRKKHASPNSAQTESVCAGALGIRLAGDASYFGKMVKKPYIGDALRNVEYEDIKRANRLMYVTAWMCEAICLIVLLGVQIMIGKG
ncbi:MAG: adenosylcobinamide-phosphate synthase CbiB [Bacillus sp. (in: Bacteria)]|nr:adenosylcobinamide-phosphate synthase CbiB [Bacillus sp. (in: firmicutes)]MCM1427454.1 adenosylcobinamide-phosphate synthase CbiB [Eubacterium sp.]